jgi:hypothetical protein
MENTLLSIVLFIAYFCTISCLIYSPSNSEKSQNVATKAHTLPIEKAVAQMLDELENSESLPVTAESFPFPEVSKNEGKQVESHFNEAMAAEKVELAIEPPTQSQKEQLKAEEETEIDLSKLPLRQARKVAKALNIHQKVNGKDAPVKWLRLQILQRVQEEPNAIAKVYEVLGIKVDTAETVDDRVSA